LQWVCFNVHYTDQAVEDIKESLKAAAWVDFTQPSPNLNRQEEDGQEPVVNGLVTRSGFRILFELMLEVS
jgi:hypothetical protein